KKLPDCLETLVTELCGSGIIPRRDIGELAARLLLLCPRIAASDATFQDPIPLPNITLVTYLEALLGPVLDSDFKETFDNTWVNFHHWVVLSGAGALPNNLDRTTLANLWARGAAIQWWYNQASVHLLFITYRGSNEPNALFDPRNLSAVHSR
ncbi:hypothetical protein DACRYDRAFT_21704, partial [Dacryopinax primogenitus]